MSKGTKVFLDDSFEIKRFRKVTERPVVQVALGVYVAGAVAPHVNPGDSTTSCLGGMFRFCRKIDQASYSRKYRADFRQFVQRWLADNVKPLDNDTDFSVGAWLEHCNYPARRKMDLANQWAESNFDLNWTDQVFKKVFEIKSFIKDETYVDWKHARAINSRSDLAKCIFGPYVQAVSNVLMKGCPEFIKYVPVHERPAYIIDRLDGLGQDFISSDYTSFEAHFTRDKMIDCEMQMYEYMLGNIPDSKRILHLLRKAKYLNPNTCKFKHFTLSVVGKRMSGEMDTSLANGFSNLMWLYYACDHHGIDYKTKVRAVIEGDDAACRIEGVIPDSFFTDFGTIVKIEKFKEVEKASFCGMVFDRDEQANVTDPICALVEFGWTTRTYFSAKKNTLNAIMRCKALSMAYQYRNCPLLAPFAYRLLKLTAGFSIEKVMNSRSFTDSYNYEILLQAIAYAEKNGLVPRVGYKTRMLVEDVYGITIEDQLAIERYFEKMEIGAIVCPELDLYMPPVYKHCYEQYVLPRSTRQPSGEDLLFATTGKNEDLGVFI